MNAAEAGSLIVHLTRELSVTRADRDAWHFLAVAAIDYSADVTREIEMIDARKYVCHTHVAAQRDLAHRQTEAAA